MEDVDIDLWFNNQKEKLEDNFKKTLENGEEFGKARKKYDEGVKKAVEKYEKLYVRWAKLNKIKTKIPEKIKKLSKTMDDLTEIFQENE